MSNKYNTYPNQKWFRIAPYHQDMINELMKAHGMKNESELFRHLIEWEWDFIHVWNLPEERTNNGK